MVKEIIIDDTEMFKAIAKEKPTRKYQREAIEKIWGAVLEKKEK